MKCSFPFNSKLFIDCCEKDVCERFFLSDNNIRHPLEAARSRIAFDWKTLLAVKTCIFCPFSLDSDPGKRSRTVLANQYQKCQDFEPAFETECEGQYHYIGYNMNWI